MKAWPFKSGEWLLFNTKQAAFQWTDDDVHFVLDQHA
jgi:hypothetical protein